MQHCMREKRFSAGILKTVEAVVHAFDHCWGCSTHANRHAALQVALRSPDGHMLDEIWSR